MKHFFFFLIIFWPGVALATLDVATLDYLRTPPLGDWTTIALSQHGIRETATLATDPGTSTTDLARRIIVLVSLGKNPRTFDGRDLVTELKNKSTNGQFGNPQLLNDDAWGVIVLRLVGLAASDPVISASVAQLQEYQNDDGGWGFAVSAESDVDDTAATVMALYEAGATRDDNAIVQAHMFLERAQNDDGGYPFLIDQSSNAASTAWALWARRYLEENDMRGKNFLASLRLTNGSYRWHPNDTSGNKLVTAYTAIALREGSEKRLIVPLSTQTSTPPPIPPPVIVSSPPTPVVVEPSLPTPSISSAYHLTPNTSPSLLRLILDRGTVRVGEPITAWVETNRNGIWEAVDNVRIHGGPVPLLHTRKSGTLIYFVSSGPYQLRAEGDNYLTSPIETVIALPLTEINPVRNFQEIISNGIKPYVETPSPPPRRLNPRRRVSSRRKQSSRTIIRTIEPGRLPTIGPRPR